MTKMCPQCKQEKPVTEYYEGYLSWCKDCHRKQSREFYRANREKRKAYASEHKERYKQVNAEWRRNNPEKAKAIWARSRAKKRLAREAAKALIPPPTDKQCYRCKERKPFAEFNANRHRKDGLNTYCRPCSNEKLRQWNSQSDKMKGYTKAWRDKNHEKVMESVRERKLRVRKIALAKWADRKAIAKIYAEAAKLTKETGIQHDVDHIIPLKNPLVSGLHVENNLQILTRSQNAKKHNKYV